MTGDHLAERHCTPCRGDAAPLTAAQAAALAAHTPAWTVVDGARAISREFAFKDFRQTMVFVNAIAWIADREDHHPDLEVGYRRCAVRYTTHAIGGLSENDFICAARIDALLD